MKKYKALGAAFALAVVYSAALLLFESDIIANIVGTSATIIGLIGLWLSLMNEQQLNEAKFIMDYNSKFISDPNLTAIEHELEEYYKDNNRNLSFDGAERQTLINYLVYLEALSSLVFHDVLPISQIDDLFSYRFFIAVNNPVVQQLELIPDAEFYKGTYKLYRKWSAYRKKRNLKEPMRETALEKVPAFDKFVG